MRTALIRAVHARARELGLEEADRRAIQHRVTGKDSCANMTADELRRVLAEMDRQGRPGRSRDRLPDVAGARVVRALWGSGWNLGVVKDRSEAALCAWIRRQTGLASAAWVHDARTLSRVIEALKRWLAREAEVDWRPYPDPVGYRPRARVIEAQCRLLGIAGQGLVMLHIDDTRADAVIRNLGERIRERPSDEAAP